MAARSKADREIDQYRKESDVGVLVPNIPGWFSWKPSTRRVLDTLCDDPRVLIDDALRLRVSEFTGRPMTVRTFRKAVQDLRDKGLITGDRVAPDFLRSWRGEWRKIMRQGIHFD
jgi:hypothetical protein